MSRAMCSADDIHELICRRIVELPSVQGALDDVEVHKPRAIEDDATGCNWMIEVSGLPLEAYDEVMEIVREARALLYMQEAKASLPPAFMTARLPAKASYARSIAAWRAH